jgi:hypothetical protein
MTTPTRSTCRHCRLTIYRLPTGMWAGENGWGRCVKAPGGQHEPEPKTPKEA